MSNDQPILVIEDRDNLISSLPTTHDDCILNLVSMQQGFLQA